jgi:2-polyprenyl-3-methyl-5-hydroxy-6-metoxy-1,4-benzoquinol methylase
MKLLLHQSAKPSHYNKESESYDAFNEARSALINSTLEKVLRNYNAKTVLDLTCGTGSQVFWLVKRGFTVIGSDINKKMLKIAKDKAKKEKQNIQFIQGDVRTVYVGEFDAIITIFNSIGHLTKTDFEKALHNIGGNLKKDGLYIFDIANLEYFLKDNHILDLTIDWVTITDDTRFRDIQYSTINTDGILTFYTTSIIQKGSGNPKVTKSAQTLQIYAAKQLKELLNKNGFKVIEQCGIDGSKFIEDKTDRILTIAQKQ